MLILLTLVSNIKLIENLKRKRSKIQTFSTKNIRYNCTLKIEKNNDL